MDTNSEHEQLSLLFATQLIAPTKGLFFIVLSVLVSTTPTIINFQIRFQGVFMPVTTSPNTRKPASYYNTLTAALIFANAHKLSYAATVTHLNGLGLLSPTGKIWSIEILKQTFKKLRHADKWPSFLHHHFLLLAFEGKYTISQVAPLFKSRRVKAA